MMPKKDDYPIGFKKPPAEHQFKKGRSGNPRGRPKGAKNRVPPPSGAGVLAQPVADLIRRESFRSVRIREGGKEIEISVIGAAMRSLGVRAIKGSPSAIKELIRINRDLEAQDLQERSESLRIGILYKSECERQIAFARRYGMDEPEFLPHPSDIIVDFERGECRVDGPVSQEELQRLQVALKVRDEYRQLVASISHGISNEQDLELLKLRQQMLRSAEEIYVWIEEQLPARFRADS